MSMKTRIVLFVLLAATLAGFKAAAQAPGLHRSEVSTLGKNSQVVTNITKETFITAVWSPTNPACWTDGDGNKWKEIRTTNYIRGFVVDGIYGIATQAFNLAIGDHWAYSTTLTNAGGAPTQYDYTTTNIELKKLFYTVSSGRWTTQARMFEQWGAWYYFYSTPVGYETSSFNVTNSNGGTISLTETNIPASVTVTTQLVDRVQFASHAAAQSSIIQPIQTAATNIVMTATNGVYYVALSSAANISFDFSALSLGGTKHASATVYLDCQTTQALYSVINTNLVAMDCAWEPTVTGRYELAVSSDGVRTTARQAWPTACEWRALKYMGGGVFDAFYGFWNFDSSSTTNGISFYNEFGSGLIRFRISIMRSGNGGTGRFSVHKTTRIDQSFASGTAFSEIFVPPDSIGISHTRDALANFSMNDIDIGIKLWILGSPDTAYVSQLPYGRNFYRRANALERAAYNAGSYPAAFRLDY